MLECVINVSEGQQQRVLSALAAAGGRHVLDVHADAHHHRSVLTMAGEGVEDAARRVVAKAVSSIDLRMHGGAHPRLGAADVVPFVPLAGSSMADAIRARDAMARWAAEELGLPCFLYGPERSLPSVRRQAFEKMAPDTGPREPHPTAGAACVGARPVLVAYNLWLAERHGPDVATRIASAIRGPGLRALGFAVGGRAQVSCNLIDPLVLGPDAAYDAVAEHAEVDRAELVGLVPAATLYAIPSSRWAQLDLKPSRTIEARLVQAGLEASAGRGER